MTDVGLFEAIYSARSLRRLKPDPVPEELITRILDAAIRAPSAGNAQNWAFVVVRDPEQRRKLGAIYRKASDIASAMYAARGRPPHLTEEQLQSLMASGSYLWDHMADAPVILVPCQTPPRIPPPESLPPDIRARYAEEERYVKKLLAICDRFAPGTSALVADVFPLTPPKIERHFGIHRGHIHHVDNAFGFADRLPYATPIPGVYSCSAGCHPAGSVIGAAGHNSAQRVLRDLGR